MNEWKIHKYLNKANWSAFIALHAFTIFILLLNFPLICLILTLFHFCHLWTIIIINVVVAMGALLMMNYVFMI